MGPAVSRVATEVFTVMLAAANGFKLMRKTCPQPASWPSLLISFAEKKTQSRLSTENSVLTAILGTEKRVGSKTTVLLFGEGGSVFCMPRARLHVWKHTNVNGYQTNQL